MTAPGEPEDLYAILGEPEDLYAVLGARPDAEHGQLKCLYQRLARATHPDKQAGGGGGGAQFARVQRAWRVLGDPAARAQYDRRAAAARLSAAAVEAELALHELEWRPALDAYWRDCRCGDGFSVPRHQLPPEHVLPADLLVQCDSCSLTIRVLLTPDDVTAAADA